MTTAVQQGLVQTRVHAVVNGLRSERVWLSAPGRIAVGLPAEGRGTSGSESTRR